MLRIVAILDDGIGSFMRPICTRSNGEAIRSFIDEVNRPDSDMGKHAADYTLYEIGAFDEETGALKPLQLPNILMRANDALKGRS